LTVQNEIKPIDCPHCKGKIDVEIERKPAKVIIERADPIENDLAAEIEKAISKRTPAKVEEKPEKKVLPVSTHQPFYSCPNGNCDKGGIHENPQHKTKIKGKCNNCDQFTPGKKCLFCGSDDVDDVDYEDLKDLGILEPIENHEGHNHE
jgi:hypothetical protein